MGNWDLDSAFANYHDSDTAHAQTACSARHKEEIHTDKMVISEGKDNEPRIRRTSPGRGQTEDAPLLLDVNPDAIDNSAEQEVPWTLDEAFDGLSWYKTPSVCRLYSQNRQLRSAANSFSPDMVAHPRFLRFRPRLRRYHGSTPQPRPHTHMPRIPFP